MDVDDEVTFSLWKQWMYKHTVTNNGVVCCRLDSIARQSTSGLVDVAKLFPRAYSRYHHHWVMVQQLMDEPDVWVPRHRASVAIVTDDMFIPIGPQLSWE